MTRLKLRMLGMPPDAPAGISRLAVAVAALGAVGALLTGTPARAQACGAEAIRRAASTCDINRSPLTCIRQAFERAATGAGGAVRSGGQAVRDRANQLVTFARNIDATLRRETNLNQNTSIASQLVSLGSAIVRTGVNHLRNWGRAAASTITQASAAVAELGRSAGREIRATSAYRQMHSACSPLQDKYRAMSSSCETARSRFSVTSPVQSLTRIKTCIQKAWDLIQQAVRCGPAARAFVDSLPATAVGAAGRLAREAVSAIQRVFTDGAGRWVRLQQQTLANIRRDIVPIVQRGFERFAGTTAGQELITGDHSEALERRLRAIPGDLISRAGDQIREAIDTVIRPIVNSVGWAAQQLCDRAGALTSVCRCAVDAFSGELVRRFVRHVATDVAPPLIRAAYTRIVPPLARAIAAARRGASTAASRASRGLSAARGRAGRALTAAASDASHALVDTTAATLGINIERGVEKQGNVYRGFGARGMPHFCVSACGQSEECQAFTWSPTSGRCRLMRSGGTNRTLANAISGVKGHGLVQTALRTVTGAGLTAAAWVARAMRDGVTFLEGAFREVLASVRTLDCNRLVAFAARNNPTTQFLDLVPQLRTCSVAFSQGFLCSIPDMVVQLGRMIAGIARAAWEHRATCLLAGVATTAVGLPGMGALYCGIYHYIMPPLRRVGRCVAQIWNHPTFWNELYQMIRTTGARNAPTGAGGNELLNGLVQFACRSLGQFTLDVVIAVASEGTSIPTSFSRWLAGALPLIGTRLSGVAFSGRTAALRTARTLISSIAANVRRYAPQCGP